MCNYTKEKTFSDMFHDFITYMSIDKKTLLKVSGVTEENVDDFIKNIDITTLDEKDVVKVQAIIFNNSDSKTFEEKCKDDEVEYCWNIGKEMFQRCTDEIASRQKETQGPVRVSVNKHEN